MSKPEAPQSSGETRSECHGAHSYQEVAQGRSPCHDPTHFEKPEQPSTAVPTKKECAFGDLTCPCQDGDSCNHVEAEAPAVSAAPDAELREAIDTFGCEMYRAPDWVRDLFASTIGAALAGGKEPQMSKPDAVEELARAQRKEQHDNS
jgi:hypothetical protein